MNMRKLVIDTQNSENYAAHDWDGQGECPQGWKMKGGNTYTMYGEFDTSIPHNCLSDTVKYLSKLIEATNHYDSEVVIGWRVVDADQTVTEEWESEKVIAKNFYGNYVLSHETYYNSTESWIMLPEGERTDYINLRSDV